MNAPLETILAEYRTRLQKIHEPRLKRLVLFGSWARVDADPESDIDVMIVLDRDFEDREERERISKLDCDLSLKYDTVITPIITADEMLNDSGLPLYRNVRREGVTI